MHTSRFIEGRIMHARVGSSGRQAAGGPTCAEAPALAEAFPPAASADSPGCSLQARGFLVSPSLSKTHHYWPPGSSLSTNVARFHSLSSKIQDS